MNNTKKNSGSPLWLELKNKLIAEIMSLKFEDKDKFYTIKEMCNLFKVSDITARRVMDELVKEKLLDKNWGKGCFVIKKSTPVTIIMPMPGNHSFQSLQLLSIIYFELYRGIFEGIDKYNCELIPVSFDYIYSSDKTGQFILQPGTIYSKTEEEDLLNWVEEKNHICVSCHALESRDNISTIRIDLFKGGYDATAYLLKQGYNNIALISTDINSSFHAPRFDGYYKALKKSGINLDLQLVKVVDHKDPATTRTAMKELMALDENRPQAILATSSFHMTQVLGFCRENSIRIPDDLALICFDNTPELALNDPPVTVVDLLWQKNSCLAVKLLSELAEKTNPQPRDILLKPELIIRESTAKKEQGKSCRKKTSEK